MLCKFVQRLLCLCTQVGQKRPHTDAGAAVEQLSAAFIDLMAGDQDSRRLILTENGALTHASSGSAAVDFFFNVADTTSGQGARQFLEQVGNGTVLCSAEHLCCSPSPPVGTVTGLTEFQLSR